MVATQADDPAQAFDQTRKSLEAKALRLPMSRRRQEAALLERPAADPQDPIRAPQLKYDPASDRKRHGDWGGGSWWPGGLTAPSAQWKKGVCYYISFRKEGSFLSQAARLCHGRLLQPRGLHGCQRRAREVCGRWPLGPFWKNPSSIMRPGLTAFKLLM